MSTCDRIDTLVSAPHGAFFGPLAHGFACGAHIPVHNADPWNVPVDPAVSQQDTREDLWRGWGIRTPLQWRAHVDRLLAGERASRDTDLVLYLRRQLLDQGGRCDLPLWRESLDAWCQLRGIGGAVISRFAHEAGLITRYEARFRADGLLPFDGISTSVVGYDLGRVVNMARWGFGARFCDLRTAETIIVRAGRLARQRYASWPDFGAGYALGLVLRLDDERYGHLYDSVLGPHLVLMGDPTSPWRHLRF